MTVNCGGELLVVPGEFGALVHPGEGSSRHCQRLARRDFHLGGRGSRLGLGRGRSDDFEAHQRPMFYLGAFKSCSLSTRPCHSVQARTLVKAVPGSLGVALQLADQVPGMIAMQDNVTPL